MRIVSIIPIKLQNERLPGKNTKILNGKPMIHYVLSKIDRCDYITKNYVYCSDSAIIPFIKKYKKTIFLKRPSALDSSSTNFTEIFSSFVKKVDADIYVYLHATAPILSLKSINKCISAVISKGYDSSFTARKINSFAWINGKPNYDIAKIPRTQDLCPIFIETSGVYVFKKGVFKKNKSRIGEMPYINVVSDFEAIDVDEYKDFKLAECILRNKLYEQD